MVGKNIRNYIQYFLCVLIFVNCICLACIVVSYVYCCHLMRICCHLIVCVVPYVYLLYLMCICCTLCVFVVLYVYFLYYMCISVLTLDAGLLARSQYPEGPATGHLDRSFSWFSCVYKRMLRSLPSFQVATSCFSCSPPDLNFLVTYLIFVYM